MKKQIHLFSIILAILTLGQLLMMDSAIAQVKRAIRAKGLKEYQVIDVDRIYRDRDEMMRKYLRELNREVFARRAQRLDDLKRPEHIKQYQTELREAFIEQMDFPKRTPLHAQVVGHKEYKHHRIEKVVFESQPGFYVPAILYLPKTPPPYPGVLYINGHEATGKATGKNQDMGITLAQQGIAVLSPDMIGHGERRQLLDDAGQALIKGVVTEHVVEGIASVLLGRSLASYMIWDVIRSIDYLVSRPDIIDDRIGCMGNSGGGNLTTYVMAIDERIACAAPACYIATHARKNEIESTGDVEQNIHNAIKLGIDIPDYIIMRAPKPTLILSATWDFEPIIGAWETHREANRIYTKMGFPERLAMVESDTMHGLSRPLRIGALRWMRRWLLGIDEPTVEKEYTLEPEEFLNCTPRGQVLLLSESRSIFELHQEREKELARDRKRFLKKHSAQEIRSKIRELTGIVKFEDFPEVSYREIRPIRREGYIIQKGKLIWKKNIVLPYLYFQPEKPNGTTTIYLHEDGKHIHAGIGGEIEEMVLKGNSILAIDVRGLGETQTTPWHYLSSHQYAGKDMMEIYIADMLGKSFLGMRTNDILAAAKFIRNKKGKKEKINLISFGEQGPSALHALALEPELFGALTITKSLQSWKNVVETPITKQALINVVHAGLKYYDLPDLIKLTGEKNVKINHPVNAANEMINKND